MAERLTPIQMAGQLMMPAAFINDREEEIRALEELISDHRIGGICFFHSRASAATNFEGKRKIPYNEKSLDRLRELIARYSRAADEPLLIAMDAEWGLAMRVENSPQYPYALALGALDDDDPLLYETGLRMAADCRGAGIHWNLSPVADVNTDPANPVIGYRSFGGTPASVARKAVHVYRGLRDGGLLSCAKHFPGHGDTSTDSHLDLPVLDKTMDALEGEEFIPFRALIREGIPAVMTGHLSIPALDPEGTPASLSPVLIGEVLRHQLGFEGLVITDALNMHAVSKRYPQPGEVALRALRAGNDILCFVNDIPESLARIASEVPAGQIREHFLRVWAIKKQVFAEAGVPLAPAFTPKELNAELAPKCLTELRRDPGLRAAFAKEGFTLIGTGPSASVFADGIREDTGCRHLEWDLAGSENSLEDPATQNVLLALAPPSQKPPGTFGVSEAALARIKTLLESHKVWLYHFGNPYAINAMGLQAAAAILLAYQHLPAFQQAACRHFLENEAVTGRLPVNLKI